jgi:pimeloyl-ACP methyl ester carboxylesterase
MAPQPVSIDEVTMLRNVLLSLLLLALTPLASVAAEPAAPSASAGFVFRYLTATDGVPLNVVETGNPQGPAIIFLHGYTQSYLSWHPQLGDTALRAKYRLIAVDLRGHGASGKPWEKAAYAGHLPWARDVRRVVEELGVTRPMLVGWSFGGFVAMDYVREYGEAAVAGVMMTGSHGGLLPRPVGLPPAFTGDLDLAIDGARTFMKMMSVEPPAPATVDRGTYANVMMPAYVRNAMWGKRLDNTDLTPRLQLPVLLILGRQDLSLPADAIATSLASRSNITVRIFEQTGHSAFIEHPARFNQELAAFVGRTDSVKGSQQ